MQAYLKKHGPGHATNTVKIEWKLHGRELTLEFNVNKRSSKSWQTDAKFSNDWSQNWGLWSTDVVEAFIQLRKDENDLSAPYLEVQVSPLNQPFALIIVEPRKTFHYPKVLDFSHEVILEGRSWKSVMKVTLPDDLTGTVPFAGFFACLEESPREFYALEPNPEENPDFHRPELFVGLAL